MRFNKQGITYLYHGDRFTRMWPWNSAEGKFYSQEFNRYFNNLNDYWKYHGSFYKEDLDRDTRIEGFSYEELLTGWVRAKFPYDAVVILKDIDLSEKTMAFWMRIPTEKIECLQRDIVVLRCNSKQEVIDIMSSIDAKFSEVYGFYAGMLLGFNV